jgi:hypothetical protein
LAESIEAGQSTPSPDASARSRVRTERGRLTACPQSARKAKERSLNRHARGVRRWFPERFGNLVRVPSALDPGEDQLAILRAQRGQPVLVAGPGFAAIAASSGEV